MIKNWVLKVPLTIVRLTSSRVIRGGAFEEQVQWWKRMRSESKEKSYFLPLFENILIVDALELYFKNKISFTQNSHKTLRANHGANSSKSC